MIRFVMAYGAIHLNVLFLSCYLVGILDREMLLLLQVGFLVVMCWDWLRYGKRGQTLSWKVRAGWVLLGFFFMVLFSLLVSLLASEVPHNQERLMEVQSQVPLLSFLLFLWNASIAEEYVYRQLLWERLKYPLFQMIITSILFSLAHHPSSLATSFIYGGLGVTLGFVRLKTDAFTALLLHVSWNVLVLSLSIL
ncbi:CPBP family intramembrane glutamic endopeptidase [Streptococcus merionis]|uniref:CPBP family intramembrane glutamic endopeptidase n=1 Tax=Streptococcus merionis TaxID=400065 RepID=UPI0026ECBE52|nr:CPBP family intramembrane glutamic endopeptidase [Streptococcus merionis]